jgi:hypothetical protein
LTTLISSLGDASDTSINSYTGNTYAATGLNIAAGAELVFSDLI